ncbi:transcription initiation factor IIF subunit alpha [Pyrus x bretschneideri]|uniref:transcription initiation factor IIF subunit alpha n=1 Tax=Pyrus x bretschneideri TaxID=225117 RepID=UPI00202FB701|nr:transcription initiation factor IIF subunit alpha [Pyrus x bretschneideri]
MSTTDLILRPECGGCKTTKDLYGSNCKHLTLCDDCGKKMALNRAKCNECGAVVTRLIREYNVRASTANDKNYFIGRFVTGLPCFSKNKNFENKWSLHKDGLQGRQLSDAMREKYKNKPWVLEDESGRSQYQGHLEGAQTATYYLLIKHPSGKEFSAIPAGSWFNFNKVAQYKQLTLEEAEEKISNRKKTADGYERWMMKAANNGAALFGEVERLDKDNGGAGGKGRRKTAGGDDDEEGNGSDRGDEDDDEELERKKRLNKRGGDGGDGDDDNEGVGGGDVDMDDDDIEKGDDWEHEEIFTDDDEAVGNNPEEREDLEPEIPAPPEIKQDDEDEDEDDKEGGLSKSGKELKKLLGRSGGLNDSDVEDDDDDDDDLDDDIGFPPALAPKQKDAPKEEPSDNSPSKPTPSASSRGTTPTSKPSKGKRKSSGDDSKATNSAPPKKVKTENEQKSIKEEPVSVSASKSSAPPKVTPPVKTEPSSSGGRVTEEEIRAVLMQRTPLTTNDLVSKFKGRLKSSEEKTAFSNILRRISKIKKGNGTSSYIVLKER